MSQERLWIIEYRYSSIDSWQPARTARGGLGIQAFQDKKGAATEVYEVQQTWGKENVRLIEYIRRDAPSPRKGSR